MSNEEAEHFKEQGNSALQKGDYIEAINCYTNAIELNPNNHIYYSNRSAVYLKLKKYHNALADARFCIELAPNFVKGFYRKGVALSNLNKHTAASVAFTAGLEIEPNNQALKDALAQSILRVESARKSKSTPADGNESSEERGHNQQQQQNAKNGDLNDGSSMIPFKSNDLMSVNSVLHVFEASFNMVDMLMSNHWNSHKDELIKMIRSFMPDQRMKLYAKARQRGAYLITDVPLWVEDYFRRLLIDSVQLVKLTESILYVKHVRKTQGVSLQDLLLNPIYIVQHSEHLPKLTGLMNFLKEASNRNSQNPALALTYIFRVLSIFCPEADVTLQRQLRTGMLKTDTDMKDELPVLRRRLRKKHRHCHMCPSISDETFHHIHIDDRTANDLLAAIADIRTSIYIKKTALERLSHDSLTARHIITKKYLRSLLQVLIDCPNDGFEIVANIFAHTNAHEFEIDKAVTKIFATILTTMKPESMTRMSSQFCRLLANIAFANDRYACMLEAYLPNLLLEVKKKNPSIAAMRAIACFCTVPALQRTIYRLGFVSYLVKHSYRSKLEANMIVSFAVTAQDWLSSSDIIGSEVIDYNSKFNPHIDDNLFTTHKTDTPFYHPISPTIFPHSMSPSSRINILTQSFIITACDGGGIFRLFRVYKKAKYFQIMVIMISCLTSHLRDAFTCEFANSQDLDKFLNMCLSAPVAQKNSCSLCSMAILPNNIASDFVHCSEKVTSKFRKFEPEESICLQLFHQRHSATHKKAARSIQHILKKKVAEFLAMGSHQRKSFSFYRELFTQPTFINFHFVAGDALDFGFRNTPHGNYVPSSISAPCPNTISQECKEWITDMSYVIGVNKMASEHIKSLFNFMSVWFTFYGDQSVAWELAQTVKDIEEKKNGYLVEVPAVRAFLERSIFFCGTPQLPLGTMINLYQQQGLSSMLTQSLEHARPVVPVRLFPRMTVIERVAERMATYLKQRKQAKKDPPSSNVLQSILCELLFMEPEVTDRVASTLSRVMYPKLGVVLEALWEHMG